MLGIRIKLGLKQEVIVGIQLYIVFIQSADDRRVALKSTSMIGCRLNSLCLLLRRQHNTQMQMSKNSMIRKPITAMTEINQISSYIRADGSSGRASPEKNRINFIKKRINNIKNEVVFCFTVEMPLCKQSSLFFWHYGNR